MKERQRWRPEEDALLRAYVKHYGPREWNLVSQRMNTPLDRDSKSCLERWKNYLKPGIKKGSLTEEEQNLVIHLQAKYGNKWKKIAAEVPGRTAKRLGKWWEVFKEKQQRENKESTKVSGPVEEGKYNQILENFAEKLVKEHLPPTFAMSATNTGYLQNDRSTPPQPANLLPSWLANSNPNPNPNSIRPPPSPSVTLSLSPATISPPWLNSETPPIPMMNIRPFGENLILSELSECCREVEEGHKAWAAHKKEAAWRLKRVELQLESEKVSRKREKTEEIESKIRSLREEQNVVLERIEAEHREQLASLRRDAETKEQKLADQWANRQHRLLKFVEEISGRPRLGEPNGR